MRVIAGSARRTQLKTLEGMDTRPTTDRIKETLFNMIAPYLYDSIFLDLFAGSGGIGIEALSRWTVIKDVSEKEKTVSIFTFVSVKHFTAVVSRAVDIGCNH